MLLNVQTGRMFCVVYKMSIEYLIEVYTQPYACIASLKFWFAYKR